YRHGIGRISVKIDKGGFPRKAPRHRHGNDMGHAIDARNRYADTTGIDGCKSPDMRIEFAQLGLIARDGYSPDFLESQLGARIHKSWIQMLSAGIDLLIVGRYLCIFPDKFNHFSINKYDP